MLGANIGLISHPALVGAQALKTNVIYCAAKAFRNQPLFFPETRGPREMIS